MITWPGQEVPLDGVTHILNSIAPDAEGDPVLAALGDRIAAAEGLEWVGYLSTTAVYGHHDGAWVDEDTPVMPSSQRGDWRALAEAQWQAIPGLPLHIFRLAGIYGPGRGPFAKLMAGKARRIVKPGQVFSRIHVDDIARVTELAAAARLDGTFNLGDDEPAPPQDVIVHAAALLGIAPPPEMAFDAAAMTPMQASFYADNKRCSNAAIKQALGIELLYPTFREGLAQVLETRS